MPKDFSKIGHLSTSRKAHHDVIIVGSGHNGLLTAAYLAKAGKKVLVLERKSYPGGGVASLPMAEPGFVSERHSAIHQMILANPLIINDELGLRAKYGLEYLPLEPAYAIIFENGCLPLYQDRKRTAEIISSISTPKEGQAYERFAAMGAKLVELMIPGMFVPPSTTPLDLSAHPDVARALEKASQGSSLDIIEEYFTDPTVKVAILRFVTEIQLAHPKTPGTGVMAYLGIGLLDKYGLAVPRGGGTAFTSAVIRCIEDYGGEIRLNTEVTKVVTEGGRAVGVRTRAGEIRARECVVAQIHPHILGRMVDGLSPSLTAPAEKTKLSEFSLLVVHAALERPLKFKAGELASRTVMNTICPNNVEILLESYDALAQGKIPDNMMCGASCVNVADPTRAPSGKSVLHAVVMVRPDHAVGGFHGWDTVKDEVAQKLFRYLDKYLEGFTPDQVRGYHVVTPVDHQDDTPSFQRGDIVGLAMSSDQMGALRPTPSLAQYRVPGVRGLYLTGPFMHPGGGVWGGGRPTAVRIMEDLGIDFATVLAAKAKSWPRL
ncbi:hypothetical protein BJX66DRAFT_134784 [Aspergillus keveii]|uniref:Pyridine nucleotide-disulfide oxidoreductase domain-containing protein 2 n=1 Tax=Aspergillus keveii TaxID=714993 RepID=A0ABR4FJ37_9EURO